MFEPLTVYFDRSVKRQKTNQLVCSLIADIEMANRHGHTNLMIASYRGHAHIVKYLLNLEADVNRKSLKGNTALHDCAEGGSLDIIKMLIKHGARMDVDHCGMTPLHAAAVTGYGKTKSFIDPRLVVQMSPEPWVLKVVAVTQTLELEPWTLKTVTATQTQEFELLEFKHWTLNDVVVIQT